MNQRMIKHSAGFLAIAFLGVSFVSNATTKPTAEGGFELMPLSPDTYSFNTTSGNTQKIGSNSGFIVTSQGVVVIDTHASVATEKKVLTEIKKVTNKPVTHVINTHYHWDHVGGNGVYDHKAITIIAHEDAIKPMGKIRVPTTGPNLVISKNHQIFSGNDKVIIFAIGKGHTAGDLAVYYPKDKTLYMGDLYVRGYIGYLGEAYLKEWIIALDKMLDLKPKKVVPGHGLPGNAIPLNTYRNYLWDFATTARTHFEKFQTSDGYTLPKKYQSYKAQNYLEINLKRAFELWQLGDLDI